MLTKTEVYSNLILPGVQLMSHNLHEYANNDGEKTSINSMEKHS